MHLFLSVLEKHERKQITQQIRAQSRINMVQCALICSVPPAALRKEHANHLNIVRRSCPTWGEKKKCLLSGFRKTILCHLNLWQDWNCSCPQRLAAYQLLRAEHNMPRNLVISCREEWVFKKPNCLRWKMRQSWQCFLKFCLGVQLTSDSWKKVYS